MAQLNFTQPPFDVLTPAERQSIKKHTQVRYLEKDENLNQNDKNYFFVVVKGNITHTNNSDGEAKFVGDFQAVDGHNDWFHPIADHNYTASIQTLLFQIDGEVIEKIAAQNRLIRPLLNGEVADKIKALKQRNIKKSQPTATNDDIEQQQLMLQPITNINLIPAHFVEETDSMTTAAKTMTNAKLKHVLVRRQIFNENHPTKSNYHNVGILTDTDICRAVSEQVDLANTPCGKYARFKLKTLEHHQDISEGLLTMLRYRIHRLPVIDDEGEIIGVLGQSDLLAYLGHHSHLITVQIEQATDLNSLNDAVEMIGQYIRGQQQNGVKIGIISRMVRALNVQVFTKLWRLIVPEAVFQNTCVIVMGSEGRGEQIMRTDQDNALIIRNGFSHPDLADFAEQFNQGLAQMGYPLCDGNIMMTNPMWRQPLNKFEKQISTWFSLKDPNYGVWVSAVLDSHFVCGDESLLDSLRKHIKIAHANADPMMIRQFARVALQFGDVGQWWQRFTPFKNKNSSADDIDLKKAGIFPLVHGIRTMAMEHDILHVTSTKARLKALARAGVITQERAETLTETLNFFIDQRLAVALSTEDKLARRVDPTTLTALERDLLKECLSVVKSFKAQLTSHYQLDYA